MRQIKIGNRTLTEADCFVIAEIGSNHQGKVETCERMIVEAARAGADAVKLQKRYDDVLFTKTALAKPYDNEFSMGKTYGEHRKALDWFDRYEYVRFKQIAKECGVDFIVTPFDIESVRFCGRLGIDAWKIASCDVRNTPLFRCVAEYMQPMIVSTGGSSEMDIMRAMDTIEQVHSNYAILYCVSKYPNVDDDLNLDTISYLRDRHPDRIIGFSSHHPGIEPCIIARTLGASIIEVHFTLNRGQKGTDHGFSLEPKGLAQLCEDVRRVSTMRGRIKAEPLPEEMNGFVIKMGKGVYLDKPLPAGAVLTEDDLVLKAPAVIGGYQPYELGDVVGKELINDCSTGVCLRKEWLK